MGGNCFIKGEFPVRGFHYPIFANCTPRSLVPPLLSETAVVERCRGTKSQIIVRLSSTPRLRPIQLLKSDSALLRRLELPEEAIAAIFQNGGLWVFAA